MINNGPDYNGIHPDNMTPEEGADDLYQMMLNHMPYPDLVKDQDRAIYCAIHTVNIRIQCHQHGADHLAQYEFWNEICAILLLKLSVEEKRRKSLEALLV